MADNVAPDAPATPTPGKSSNARYLIIPAKVLTEHALELDQELHSVEDAVRYMKDHDFDGEYDVVVARTVRVKVKKQVLAEYV